MFDLKPLKKIYDYLKRVFYYEFYTYQVNKSILEVREILYNGFQKKQSWLNLLYVDGQLVDENSFYIQLLPSRYREYNMFKYINPTCLKGILYNSDKNNSTKIEVALKAKTDCLILFIASLILGIVMSIVVYYQLQQFYFIPIILTGAGLAMMYAVGVAKIEKQKICRYFETIIDVTPID